VVVKPAIENAFNIFRETATQDVGSNGTAATQKKNLAGVTIIKPKPVNIIAFKIGFI
jgi:hypothetical protein